MKQKELWDWGKEMHWVVLEMIQNPRGALGDGTGGRGDYVVSNSGTIVWVHIQYIIPSQSRVHRNIHWIHLIKCGHMKQTERCVVFWTLAVVHELSRLTTQPPPSQRGDAVTICGEDLKLIQLQDPHPAAKDTLESRRQFRTWSPRHNGWALKVCAWQCSYNALVSFLHFSFFFRACWHISTQIYNCFHLYYLFGSIRTFMCRETNLSWETEKASISERTGERWQAFYKWSINQHLFFFPEISTGYLYSPGRDGKKGIIRWSHTKNLCFLFDSRCKRHALHICEWEWLLNRKVALLVAKKILCFLLPLY